MNVVERAKAPTPKFFKRLRSIGLALLAVSGAIMTAPIALPAVLVSVAGYTALAGGVISAVSQITVDQDEVADQSRLDTWRENQNNLTRDGTES